MKTSRVRAGLLILVFLIAVGVIGFELKDRFATEASAEAQIRELDSYWASRRRAAATGLAQFPGAADKVVPALVKTLGDSDLGVRLSAMEALKAYGDKVKPAGSLLREMLEHDSDAKVRELAAALLGAAKDRDAIPILTRALDDPAPAVRLEATWSLGRWGPGGVSSPIIDKLMSALEPDRPVELREASIEALNVLARDQERVARAIADVAAKDPSPQVRYRSVDFMSKPAYGFQIPALIAALDDSDTHVQLTAGTSLASIGLSDDRIVPALCDAALKADDWTREAIGVNFDRLVLESADGKVSDGELGRRYVKAVKELRTVLEMRKAAAREQMINVLCTVILKYQISGKPVLLEPARAAAAAVLARAADEKEEIAVRLHAVNQWGVIQLPGQAPSLRRTATQSSAAPPRDELHPHALWIAALCEALKSPVSAIRSRAGEILFDSFNVPGTDPSFREAWRQAVPTLIEVTKSEDVKVRNGTLAILRMLGPVAVPALPAMRSLARDSQERAVREAALGAIESISCADGLNASDPTLRINSTLFLGGLGWRATPALPALCATLTDTDTKVRLAAVAALQGLGEVSNSAVQPMADALVREADPVVRAAIMGALEAIAPATPAVLSAHRNALRDSDPAVRKAGASFKQVPADDSLVSVLAKALGDANDEVRATVASSLTKVLFESPAVVPCLCKAMRDNTQRPAALEALRDHLAHTSDSAEWSRIRTSPAGLKATLAVAIPALKQALNDEEIRPSIFALLGRIVSFSRMTNDAELRKAFEPAMQIYLRGLDEGAPTIRAEILRRLGTIAICRADSIEALNALLERSDLPEDERESARFAQEALVDQTKSGSRATPDEARNVGRRWTHVED